MRRTLAAAVLLVASATAAWAFSPYRPVPDTPEAGCSLGELRADNTAEMPNCPADAKELVGRAINCQHWTGEEPYDEARSHEIETAIAELQCDKLSLQHDALLKKYAKDRDVMGALQDADREYNLEF